MAGKKIHIGTSGWSNSSWKDFYPAKMKTAEMLTYYSQRFDCTEINSTFYNTPRETTVQSWIDSVPKDFMFCPKVSKFLTHIKRLKEPETSMNKFMVAIAPLQGMLGPILLQLPPSLKFDPIQITSFYDHLRQQYSEFTFALEARHVSWYEPDSLKLMEEYGIANVISESGGRFPLSQAITAHDIYIRFHGPKPLYGSPHSDEELMAYAALIKKWTKAGHDVWIFFNNTIHNDAINNAESLKGFLKLKTTKPIKLQKVMKQLKPDMEMAMANKEMEVNRKKLTEVKSSSK